MYLPAGQDPIRTDDPTAPLLARLEAQNAAILRDLQEAARHRELATWFGIAGALFAAIRLGIVALPEIRARRGAMKANPAQCACSGKRSKRRR